MQSWFEKSQKPKTYCDNSSLRSYLSPSVFTVRSGPVWRQDLAILSPEGPRDNTCQLRGRILHQHKHRFDETHTHIHPLSLVANHPFNHKSLVLRLAESAKGPFESQICAIHNLRLIRKIPTPIKIKLALPTLPSKKPQHPP